jgi:hypothetical protein
MVFMLLDNVIELFSQINLSSPKFKLTGSITYNVDLIESTLFQVVLSVTTNTIS